MTNTKDSAVRAPEIVAPAGGMEALASAAKYGADAVYLGLKEFSARARAENFTLRGLKDAVYYMHRRGKKVYLALNTLFKNDEIPRLVEMVYESAVSGVDAVILQDLGLYRIIKRHFPSLPMHASTQMACYNTDGALQLQEMGFKRVVLARELGLDAVRKIRDKVSSIELEVFVHGAMCYSFSGMCLFSSHIGGRSGNRGECAQPCRKPYIIAGSGISKHLFSMNDMCLAAYIEELKEIGVDALKIEGRMKGPSYTGYVSSFYKGLVEHSVKNAEQAADNLSLFYSRRFADGLMDRRRNEITDLDYPGNVGVFAGKVKESIDGFIGFTTSRTIEARDGLQIFDRKRLLCEFSAKEIKVRGKKVYSAAKGDYVLVRCGTDVPKDADVYLASSQKLKEAYALMKSDMVNEDYRAPLDLEVMVGGHDIDVRAVSGEVECGYKYAAKISSAKTKGLDAALLRNYFARLGGTGFELRNFSASVPGNIFISPAELNRIRRDAADKFAKSFKARHHARMEAIKDKVSGEKCAASIAKDHAVSLSVKIDRLEYLDHIPAGRFEDIIYDISNFGGGESDWDRIAKFAGKLILSLPLLRSDGVRYDTLVDNFIQRGYVRWQAQNIGDIYLLKKKNAVIYADYPLYALNAQAAAQILETGSRCVTFSPEDGKENLMKNIRALGGSGILIVYQDTPLFISKTCAYRYYKGCAGAEKCSFRELGFANEEGDRFILINENCVNVVIDEKRSFTSVSVKDAIKAGCMRFRIDLCRRRYGKETIDGALNTVMTLLGG